MPGCLVQCSIIYPAKDGSRLCGAYEYETIAMLGTNLGITDNDAIARIKFICDDLGIDAVEAGSSLGLAAEAGKMPGATRRRRFVFWGKSKRKRRWALRWQTAWSPPPTISTRSRPGL